MRRRLQSVVLVAVAASLGTVGPRPLHAVAFSIVDGEGFEAPAYSTTFNADGSLEGQFASTAGGAGSIAWVKSVAANPSTATVQQAVARSGAQSVRVAKAAGPDTFWGIQQSGFPDAQLPYVCIEWDMLVEPAMSPVGGAGEAPYGPYFGVSAYNSETTQLRLGYLGVDAQDGAVLYSDAGSGLFTDTGVGVSLGEWHAYQLILDYTNHTYSATVNGVLVLTGLDFPEPFVDGPTPLFTDANLAAISAADTPYYAGLTGTAYFDNFRVFQTNVSKPVPEPAALGLCSVGIGLVLGVRRRRGRRTTPSARSL